MACARGNLEIAEFLVKNGADINAVDKYRSTPLLYAVSNKSSDIAEMLQMVLMLLLLMKVEKEFLI